MNVGKVGVRYRVAVAADRGDSTKRMSEFAGYVQARRVTAEALTKVEHSGLFVWLTFHKKRGQCWSMKDAKMLAASHLEDFCQIEDARLCDSLRMPSGGIDEIHIANWVGSTLRFPKHCPQCGAKATEIEEDLSCASRAKYECGSEFKWKSEIQKHIHKWRFVGPCQKKDQAVKA